MPRPEHYAMIDYAIYYHFRHATATPEHYASPHDAARLAPMPLSLFRHYTPAGYLATLLRYYITISAADYADYLLL